MIWLLAHCAVKFMYIYFLTTITVIFVIVFISNFTHYCVCDMQNHLSEFNEIINISFVSYVLASESRCKASDVPSLRSLLVVEERMSSSGCLCTGWWQEGHLATKSLHQLPLIECIFPPLLFLHHLLPFFCFSCLRRTWWVGWCYQDVWRGRVKGKLAPWLAWKDGL